MRANGSMARACVTPVDGSPTIVGLFQCENWSLHQHALWQEPSMTPESLAASGSLAGSLMTPSVCSVGLLSSLALMVLSACSE